MIYLNQVEGVNFLKFNWEIEMKNALQETKKDIESGNFVVESVDAHIKRITEDFTFEKYVFGISLNNLSVAKYSDGGKVKIAVEKDGEKVTNSNELVFENQAEYEYYIDSHCDEQDQIYNTANALDDLILSITRD